MFFKQKHNNFSSQANFEISKIAFILSLKMKNWNWKLHLTCSRSAESKLRRGGRRRRRHISCITDIEGLREELIDVAGEALERAEGAGRPRRATTERRAVHVVHT